MASMIDQFNDIRRFNIRSPKVIFSKMRCCRRQDYIEVYGKNNIDKNIMKMYYDGSLHIHGRNLQSYTSWKAERVIMRCVDEYFVKAGFAGEYRCYRAKPLSENPLLKEAGSLNEWIINMR